MAAVGFEDDFHARAKKSLKQMFRQSVIPSHVIPYLRCLTNVQEEIVRAKENNYGPTLAADTLFDFIIRHPDWTDDMKRAFREPEVKLEFLSEEIDNFLREVPMRWDIAGLEDSNGSACFGGNCSVDELKVNSYPAQHYVIQNAVTDTRATHEVPATNKELPKADETVPKGNFSGDSLAASSISGTDNSESDQQMQLLKEKIPQNRSLGSATPSLSETPVDARVDIELKRENLRLKIMDKIWSFVTNPADVPIALQFMKQANLQICGIEKGSLLFKVKVNTLKDLDRLQNMVIYGGMKTILDQELIEKHMKDFQELAKTEGLELLNIKSKLYVHEPDLERCKSTLLSAMRDQKSGFESLLELPTQNFRNETDILMFKHLMEVFPPICLKMMNDPFLKPRMSKFFSFHTQGILKDPLLRFNETDDVLYRHGYDDPVLRYPGEYLKILPSRSEKKLVMCFFNWFQEEVIGYLESFSPQDKEYLIKAVRIVEPIDIMYIPVPSVLHVHPSYFFDNLARILFKESNVSRPRFILARQIHLNANMYARLVSIGVLKQERDKMEFNSALLMDTLLAFLLDNCIFNLPNAFEKLKEHDFLFLTLSLFVTDKAILREIHNLKSATSEEDRTMMLTEQSEISTDKKILDMKFYDLKLLSSLQFITSDEHLVKLLKQTNVETTSNMEISLTIECLSGQFSFQYLSQFLAVSRMTTELNINRCGQIPPVFAGYLQTGSFANLKRLSIVETRIILQMPNALGLKYLPRLQTLDLHGCNLGDTGITAVGRELALLQELREINIANNDMSLEGLQELSNSLINNHRITALRIQQNKIGLEGAVVLAGWLRRLSLLDTLNINGCEIGNLGIKYISGSIVSKVIRQLTMRENNVTEEGSTTFFQNMKSKTRLEHIDFGRNKVFDEDNFTVTDKCATTYPETELEKVTAFLHQKAHWAHISMWSCNLGAYRIFRSPEKLSAMKDLVHLCLQSNQIDDSFAEDVGAFLKEHCEHIRHVNLRHNRIGNVGAKCIADGIAGKRYLEELLMDKNQIEKDGIHSLLTVALSMTHSLQLNVACNNLAQLDIDMIASELSLKKLDSSKDSDSEKEPTTVYKPSNEKSEIEIYM